jgi:hypothetical protein
MKRLVLVISLVITAALSAQTQAQPAPAKIDPAKEAHIRQLMDVMGTKAIFTQTLDSMSQNIRPLMTNAFPPGEYREKLIDLFFAKFKAKADTQQLADMVVPIYDKYFSDEEIKGLLEFYKTPIGQKAVKTLPQITAEAGAVGQEWGRGLGEQSMTEVLAEHPELEKALNDAKKGPLPK